MPQSLEVDRKSFLAIALLSASVQSILASIEPTRSATEDQKKILKKAIELTKDICAGKIAKPSQDENLSLPSPTAAKARKFAIRAWSSGGQGQNDGQRLATNFDQIIEGYLQLFQEIQTSGAWRPEQSGTAIEARRFFARLNQVAIDNLNGLSQDVTPITAPTQYQTA